MTGRGWLSSMGARIFLLLLLGTSAAALLAFGLADLQKREVERRGREQRLADRVVDLATVLGRAPSALRPELLGPGPEAARPAPLDVPSGAPDADLTQRLAVRLGSRSGASASSPEPQVCRPAPPQNGLVVPEPPAPARPSAEDPPPPPPPSSAPDCRLVRFTLADGERLSLIIPAGPRPPRGSSSPFSILGLAVLAIAAATLAFITARVTTAPLQRLARAADGLGRDLDRPPLPVEGPSEVRQAARAFNLMQSELKRRQTERTHMLAAITHDLQTPLTRLRLRLEKVSDPALRDQLLADQSAMLKLVREGLDLARAAEGPPEPLQELEIDSLLQSLCADAVDAGELVRISGLCGAAVLTRPQALRRCASNLVDNALKYAGEAELLATHEGDAIVVRVLDRGPGIPQDQLAEVFEPFTRLETSRSRETGGAGLGLTIARLLAERANCRLDLMNRETGGLEVKVIFGEAQRSMKAAT